MSHLLSSRSLAFLALAEFLSSLGACADCGGKQPDDGRKEAIGVILEPSGTRPALEMSVLIEPPADPDLCVPKLASAANRAFKYCAALAERGDALRRGIKLELPFEQSRILPPSPAPSDAVAGCLAKNLAGAELKEMGTARRRITLFIRKAAPAEPEPAH